MATQSNSVPYYLKPAERPKAPRTFNIYKEHLSIIDADKSIEASALVRLLLDMYFSGKLPDATAAYARGEGRT